MKIAALLLLAALCGCASPITAVRERPFADAKTAQNTCIQQSMRNTPGMQFGLIGSLASERSYMAGYDACMYDQGWRGGD